MAGNVRRQRDGFARQRHRVAGAIVDQCLVAGFGRPDGQPAMQRLLAGHQVSLVARAECQRRGDRAVGGIVLALGFERVQPQQCPGALARVGAECLFGVAGGGGMIAGIEFIVGAGRDREALAIGRGIGRRGRTAAGGGRGGQIGPGLAQCRIAMAFADGAVGYL